MTVIEQKLKESTLLGNLFVFTNQFAGRVQLRSKYATFSKTEPWNWSDGSLYLMDYHGEEPMSAIVNCVGQATTA